MARVVATTHGACLCSFYQASSRGQVPRKVSFANPKLNACFYLLHLPIIVYVA